MADTHVARLDRVFYARPAVAVARDLLGRVLVRCHDGILLRARIVETEAYASDIDESSHAYRGRTARNQTMFGEAGHAYVYRSYGLHCCLNVVTTMPGGPASAVLMRALEPLGGLEDMRALRAGVRDEALLRGPGNLCKALAIDLTVDGLDLLSDTLYVLPGSPPPEPVVVTTRIGISRSIHLPWRYYLLGNPCVSRRDRAAERATSAIQASDSRSKTSPSRQSLR